MYLLKSNRQTETPSFILKCKLTVTSVLVYFLCDFDLLHHNNSLNVVMSCVARVHCGSVALLRVGRSSAANQIMLMKPVCV